MVKLMQKIDMKRIVAVLVLFVVLLLSMNVFSKEASDPENHRETIEALDEKKADVLRVFKQSDLHIKKRILFEILGLAYVDGEYEDSEDAFVVKFAEEIGLDKETVEEYETLLVEYLETLKKIVQVVS